MGAADRNACGVSGLIRDRIAVPSLRPMAASVLKPEQPPHRPIRSYVRREGRITPAQQRALNRLTPRFVRKVADGLLDPGAEFSRRAPLEVEIGCGNGDALVEMAAARRDHDFIGIEVYRPGVGKLLAGLEDAELDNVRVYGEDATEVVRHCLAPASVTRFMIFFPDPWPKKRHQKRRLVDAGFVALLTDRLAPGGEFHFATDWSDYAEQVMEIVSSAALLENPWGAGNFADRPDTRPLTKYERRGRGLGHAVFDIILRRRA